MVKYSLPPWSVIKLDECQTMILSKSGELVATISVGEGRPNGDANTSLIVTAPKLLAALVDLVSRIEGDQRISMRYLKSARAAISEAEEIENVDS